MIIVFDNNDFLYDLFPQAKEHGQNRDDDSTKEYIETVPALLTCQDRA